MSNREEKNEVGLVPTIADGKFLYTVSDGSTTLYQGHNQSKALYTQAQAQHTHNDTKPNYTLLYTGIALLILLVIALDLHTTTTQYQYNPGLFTLFEDGSFILLKKIIGCFPWMGCS